MFGAMVWWIAPTKNSEAWIYPPNEVVYHDAFEGLAIRVRIQDKRVDLVGCGWESDEIEGDAPDEGGAVGAR